MDLFMDTPIELLEKQIYANVIAPLISTSTCCRDDRPRVGHHHQHLVGLGLRQPDQARRSRRWGMGYGVSKAAFHRVAGFLATELGDKGIRCFNVQPNLIATERIGADMAEFGIPNVGAPADVIGVMCAWLVTDPRPTSSTARTSKRSSSCTSGDCCRAGTARTRTRHRSPTTTRAHHRRSRKALRARRFLTAIHDGDNRRYGITTPPLGAASDRHELRASLAR
jgi:hypothetical protein